MYQAIDKNLKEDQLNILLKAFSRTVMEVSQVVDNEDNTKWDMNRVYIPNHTARWNKISNSNRECIVLQKNNQMALVQFLDATKAEDELERMYRLEDLTPTNKKLA